VVSSQLQRTTDNGPRTTDNRSAGALQMAHEGIPYVITPVLLALLPLALGFWPGALVLVALAAFMAFFFRDPERTPPLDPNAIVSPADGRVVEVRSLTTNGNAAGTLVGIFLSPFDVHINRAPIAGTIAEVTYREGKFLPATNQQAGAVNEQNALTIRGTRVTVVCKQIAGILARRIVCWKRKGDMLGLGERFGMIKFGSRTELILPQNVEVVVTPGMHVRGGTTIVARITEK
jgi:phosphatidylserine decarboxylase